MADMISIRSVSRYYGIYKALDDVSVSYTHLTLPTSRLV